MAKKVINCAPVTEIEIITAEGESTLLRFDILMFQELQAEAGSIVEATQFGVGELAASIVYAGAKHQDTTMTLEKARVMVAHMSAQNVLEIVNEFSESMGIMEEGEMADIAKKALAQFLESMR